MGLAILLVQAGGLWPGRVGLWADPLHHAPWSQAISQRAPETPSLVLDSLRYSLPEWTLAHEELLKGRLPLWNPYIFSGFDHAGSIQPAVFSPFKVALALLPPGRGMTLHLLLHSLLFGLGTVLLVRGRGAGGPSAALAGLLVGLNGYVVAKMGQPTSVATLGWLPLLLWSQDRFLRRPGRRPAGALLLCLLAAASAGHPPYFIYMLLALALFAGVSLWRTPLSRQDRPRLTLWALLVLLLAAGGALILPLAQVGTLPTSRSMQSVERPPLTRPAPQALWGLLVPEPMGSAAKGTYAPPPGRWPPGETLGIWHAGVFIYPGALVWLLLPLGMRRLRRHPFALEGWVLFAGCYMVVYVAPLNRMVQAVPFLGMARLDRLLGLGALGLGLLAAAGLQELNRVRVRRGLLFLLAAALLQGGLLGCLHRWPASAAAAGLWRPAGLAAAGLLVLLLVLFQRRRRAWVFWLPVVLLMVDLVVVMHPYYRSVPQAGLFPDTDLIRFLQQNLGHDRLFRYRMDDPPSNTLQLFHLRDAQGFAPLYAASYRRLTGLMEPGRKEGFRRVKSLRDRRSLESPLLRILGVRYVLSREPLPGDGWHEVFQAAGVVVSEAPWAPLRARLVTSWEQVSRPRQAAAILGQPGFDPGRTAVLLGAGSPSPPWPPAAGSAGSVQFISDSSRRVDLRVTTETGGLLVLGDTYEPAWKALLNGRAVPVWRADLAFRGVFVPPGVSMVSFVYVPHRLRQAGLGSLLLWWVALGLVLWPRPRGGVRSVAAARSQEGKKNEPGPERSGHPPGIDRQNRCETQTARSSESWFPAE